jgi:ligand-binding SRPBCC domain-containing protein
MKISISTILDAPVQQVWDHVQTSRLLDYVAAPFIRFVPDNKSTYPERWTKGEYRVRMMLFGIMPIGWQIIGISYPAVDDSNTYLLRDNGRGALIKKWDHLITVKMRDGNHTEYSDDVEIKAGLLTPFVTLYASFFYRHRQRRWRRLAAADFAYEKVG